MPDNGKNMDEIFNLRASFPEEQVKKDFFEAVGNNNISALEKTLAQWPDAAEKWRDDRGRPVLMSAYNRVTPDTIDFLLKKGASLSHTQTDGSYTPLIMAAFLGEVKDVEKFLRAGADVDGKDKTNRTPLQLAVEYNPKLEIIDLLVLCGADPKHKTTWGKSIFETCKTDELRDVITSAQARRTAFLAGERKKPAKEPEAAPPADETDEIKLLKRIELRKAGDGPNAQPAGDAKKPWWKRAF